MKNNYLPFLLLCALSGYGQLATEGFENNGAQYPVGWQQINVAGPAWQWKVSEIGNSDFPPYQGSRAAYIHHENAAQGTTEDWLVTMQFYMPENGNLKFYSRLMQEGNQQSTYRTMIHSGNTSTDISAYVEIGQWTESEINPLQLQYTEINVPIPAAYFGQYVYIAFVMNGDNGDGWLIDDVGVQGTMGNGGQSTNSLSFYPNPVKDRLTISGTDELLSVKVFDSNGRECITKNDKGMIDMSGLATGLYFVKAVTAKGTVTRKVLKE